MGLKPQQEADPNLQRLLNGVPTVIEEMPNAIDRVTECAMGIERQLRELGGAMPNWRDMPTIGEEFGFLIFSRNREANHIDGDSQ